MHTRTLPPFNFIHSTHNRTRTISVHYGDGRRVGLVPVAGREAPPRRSGGRRRSRAGLLPCPGPGGGLAAGVRPTAGPSPRDRGCAARQLVPPQPARAQQLTVLGLGWTDIAPGSPRRRRPVVGPAVLDRIVAGCPVWAAGLAVQGRTSSWGCAGGQFRGPG